FKRRRLPECYDLTLQDKEAKLLPVLSNPWLEISFKDYDMSHVKFLHHDALPIMLKMKKFFMHTMMIDTGSGIEIIFQSTINQMGLAVTLRDTDISGFNSSKEERGLRRHPLEELEQAFPDEVEAYREMRASFADISYTRTPLNTCKYQYHFLDFSSSPERSKSFVEMGVSSFFGLLCLILCASSVLVCNGGITSSFVRKAESFVDMPFNSDVFRVPPGYNAPQQFYDLGLPLGESVRAGELSATKLENLMTIVANPQQFKIPDWFLNIKKDFKDVRYSEVVSNALDIKLRDDLERLKKIRGVDRIIASHKPRKGFCFDETAKSLSTARSLEEKMEITEVYINIVVCEFVDSTLRQLVAGRKLLVCQRSDDNVVFIWFAQGDQVGRAMIISSVAVDEPGSNTVAYWHENNKQKHSVEGIVLTYKYTNYISGCIHHCIIKKLKLDRKYFNEVGLGLTMRQICFTTPPPIGPDVPYSFGLMGLTLPDGPPLGSALADKFDCLVLGLLLSLYFYLIGRRVNFHLEYSTYVWVLGSMSLLGVLGNLAKTILPALKYKIRIQDVVILGLMLSALGIVDLTFYSRALANEVCAFTYVIITFVILHTQYITFQRNAKQTKFWPRQVDDFGIMLGIRLKTGKVVRTSGEVVQTIEFR
ncbi:hypothetical protein GIB67_043098, partial [Kingdonia uniflora]